MTITCYYNISNRNQIRPNSTEKRRDNVYILFSMTRQSPKEVISMQDCKSHGPKLEQFEGKSSPYPRMMGVRGGNVVYVDATRWVYGGGGGFILWMPPLNDGCRGRGRGLWGCHPLMMGVRGGDVDATLQ